jgi:integrase/recombinase XerD
MGKRVWVPVVSGPLAPYAAGFASWLRSRAYSPSAAADRLCQLDQLSRWLEREGLGVYELTGEQAERFVAARRAAGRVTWVSPRSVMMPLEYLRELGVAPAPAPVVAQGLLEELLQDYRRYLSIERGLSDHTVLDAYGPAARLFLAGWESPDGLGLERLSAADVSSFLARECPKRSVSGARDLVCALRSLLRYLHLAGVIEAPLVWAVPPIADLRDRTLPRGLEPAAVRRLLASCDLGDGWSVGATTRFCCCWRGSGCAPARSPGCSSTTSTGGLGCCSFAGRAVGRTCCRCRWMSARRSFPIFAVARGASVGRCSCG